MLISDKRILSNIRACPKDSLYCSFTNSLTIKEQISVCVDRVFVHIFPLDQFILVSAYIKTNYLSDIPCNDINRNPTNFCQLLPIDECLDHCSSGCGLLECQEEHNSGNKNIFRLCMPDSTPETEQKRRCEMHKDVNTFN